MFELLEDAGEVDTNHINSRRLIVFTLGGSLYGLPITDVAEIREMLPITPLPAQQVPPWVLGLVNLRGMVLPVIDALKRINPSSVLSPVESNGQLVIAMREDYWVALRVDAVQGLFRLDPVLFKPAPHTGNESEFLSQVATVNGQLLIELNAYKVLEPVNNKGMA